MITVLVDDEGERLDVLESLRANLGGQVPFQILVAGRIADCYPSGWASGPPGPGS